MIFYIDGASRGNPGKSGIGVVMCDADGKEIQTFKAYIGAEATNNVAEYTALIYAMQEAVKARVKNIEIFSDSELVVRQVKGIYKIKDNKLKQLFVLFENLRSYFREFSLEYIAREKNTKADKLAAQAISEEKKHSRQI